MQRGEAAHLGQLDDMVKALLAQTKTTQDIADVLATIPRAEHYEALRKNFQQPQDSYVQAAAALAGAVSKLKARIEMWETTFLPHILDHRQGDMTRHRSRRTK